MSKAPRTGPRWPGILAGLLAALAFLVVAAIPVLFVWAWSGAHCEPKPECQRFAGRAVLVELAVIAGLAVLMGASVRALVDWAVRRRRAGGEAAAVPRRALACLIVLALLMLWLGTSLFGV